MPWSSEKAWQWYNCIEWQVGCNYVTSTAVNSTEMWQKSTFDEKTVAKELSQAREFGFNSVRVFLQFVVWEKEREAFLSTFDRFLSIAEKNGLLVLPILFDDCAFDGGQDPFYGEQLPPIPNIHNGRWTPSPGFKTADDPEKQGLLREYVHAIVSAHANDKRVLAWDLYNEPGNTKRGNLSLPLLVNVFRWARECNPSQPLTAGPWITGKYDSVFHATCELSDVLSFHTYVTPDKTAELCVDPIKKYNKPIFVTEWLCREKDNTYENHLPYFAENKISCWQWGLVAGKTQTYLHWGKNDGEPDVWQHDVIRADGTYYDPAESELLKKLRNK